MLKIGITGGIGSGKTTVSKMFEVFAIPVFYADDEAKKVMTDDLDLVDAVKKQFGNESYDQEGRLDRAYLAHIVFSDENQLAKLNDLVHPAVFNAFDRWILNQKSAPYVIKEAALLFESESYKHCDCSIVVTCPLEERINRVMLRDQTSREKIEARIAKQFTEEKKMAMADFVIRNSGRELLIPQVLNLHQRFLTLSGR